MEIIATATVSNGVSVTANVSDGLTATVTLSAPSGTPFTGVIDSPPYTTSLIDE